MPVAGFARNPEAPCCTTPSSPLLYGSWPSAVSDFRATGALLVRLRKIIDITDEDCPQPVQKV